MKKLILALLVVSSTTSMALDQVIRCRKTDDLRRNIVVYEQGQKRTILFSYIDYSGDEIIPPRTFDVQPVGGQVDRSYLARSLEFNLGLPLDRLVNFPRGLQLNDRRLIGAYLDQSPIPGRFEGEYICVQNAQLTLQINNGPLQSSFDEGFMVFVD